MGSAVLVVAILPAEFGVDPLKTGQILGLNALAAEANPFEEQLIPHRTDSVEFELGPFQSVEYKYTLDFDAPMIFSWQADGELYYDMHAEPAAWVPTTQKASNRATVRAGPAPSTRRLPAFMAGSGKTGARALSR